MSEEIASFRGLDFRRNGDSWDYRMLIDGGVGNGLAWSAWRETGVALATFTTNNDGDMDGTNHPSFYQHDSTPQEKS